MAALSVLLFCSSALDYFTFQSAENAASATPRRAPAWGATSSPDNVNDSRIISWVRLWKCLERRLGKVNTYRSASCLSHCRTPLKLNLVSLSVLQTAVIAEGGL